MGTYGTDTQLADTEGDGLPDGDEVFTYGTDSLIIDTDVDGLSDQEEVTTYGTDPTAGVMDGDEYSDVAEIEVGTDPLDPKGEIITSTVPEFTIRKRFIVELLLVGLVLQILRRQRPNLTSGW